MFKFHLQTPYIDGAQCMVTKITLIQALGANNFMILIAVIELTMLYPYIEYKLRVGIAMSDFMNGWVGLSIAG